MQKARLFTKWLYARRVVLGYVALVFGCFFVVYALYGHSWGVAGYAALIATTAGLGLAVWDYARFCAKHAALARVAGRYPTGALPEAQSLPEADYVDGLGILLGRFYPLSHKPQDFLVPGEKLGAVGKEEHVVAEAD